MEIISFSLVSELPKSQNGIVESNLVGADSPLHPSVCPIDPKLDFVTGLIELELAKPYSFSSKMRQSNALRWTFVFLLLLLNAINGVLGQQGVSKKSWLLNKAKSSDNGVIKVNSEEFQKYILKGPRAYNIILTITAIADQFNCQPCKGVKGLTDLISQTFEKARGTKSNPKHNTFFVELDYDINTQNAFQALRIQQVPQILYIGRNQKSLTYANFFESLGDENSLKLNTQLTPEFVLDWMMKKSGVKGLSLPSGAGFQSNGDSGASYVGAGSPISWFGYGFAVLMILIPVVYIQRKNFVVYFLICCAVFFFCISGGMFNIIREVPFAEYDRNSGKVRYFSNGGQMQYAAEGFIMGFLQIILGLAVVLMNTVSVKSPNSFQRNLTMVAFALFCYVIFYFIRDLYGLKMGGYNKGFVWDYREIFRK